MRKLFRTEAKMKKGKATALLTVITLIMAFLTVMTFARFPMGTKDYNSVLGAIQTDYDISGGTAYTLTAAKDNVNVVNDDNVEEVINVLKFRMNALGYQSYSVKAIKVADDYDIRIEAKGELNAYGEEDTSTLASDIAVVAAYGELAFYGGTDANPSGEDKRILKDVKVISDAKYSGAYDSGSSTVYQVSIVFTDDGYDELIDLINSNSSYYISIMLGDTELLNGSSAISESYFNSKTLVITTSTEASAKQAALQIKSGGLKYKYEIGNGVSVSAPFGDNVALMSIISVAAVMFVSLVFFAIAYKGYGVIAAYTEILFMLLYLLMLIAVPGVKISLGGVLGIIAATVLTVDGLMITAKRIKEEVASGKMIKPAVKTGLRRSFLPIINSAVVTVIVAALVFAFAEGTFRCFGITLGIGAVLSLISTLVFNRMFASLVLSANGYKYGFLGLKRSAENTAEV